ncbi:MAG: PAS domain S-box protein, partial [Thermoplasmata archaeon]|nr:PAS domain S-box protein [Thermoplasmata archaeon]
KELEVNLEMAFHRLKVERELAEKESMYKLLVDNSAEIIWASDENLNITFVSPSVKDIMGFSVKEAMTMDFMDLLTPDSLESAMSELEKEEKKKTSKRKHKELELQMKVKDGGLFWGNIIVKPIIDKAGKLTGYQGSIKDITLHKVAQNVLEEQHRRFTTLLDKFPEYLYVCDPETYEVLFVNQKLRDLAGRPLVGGKCYEEFQGKKEPCDFCTNDIILKTRMPHTWEFENTYLNRHLLITDQIIQWPDGRDVRFETAIDITDQKKIEKILQTTETKYKSFIEQSSYGFYVLDKQGNITFLNDRAKELTGVEMKKNETYGFADFISPEDYETATKNLQALAQGKKFEAARVYNIKRVDGEFRKMEVQSLPIWRDEELIGFHGTIVDVSQKVKFEEELREKTEFLDAVVNHTFDGIIVIDEDFNYKYINPASGRIMGHDPQEWIGKRAGTYRHPDDEKISTEAVFKALSGEPATCEVRVMHSDGEYRLLEMRYSLMMIGDDAHILGMVNDITEKKKVADALVASEEKYRNIVELSPDGIVTLGKTGKILSVNKSFCSLTGFDEHDFIGKNIAKIPTKPKSKIGDTIKVLGQAFKGKELGTIKFKWTHITGEVRDGEARIKKMSRKNDAYFQVVVRDITDEKRVEVALIASEEKYRSLFEFSPDAIVILNLEGRVIECNQSTSKLLEMPMDEIIGHSFEDMGILDEHQVKYYDELFQYLIAGNKVDNNEVELVMKGGQSKWVDTFPSLVTKDGEFYAVQMIARDITSRKLAEVEMRKKLMKFELDYGNLYLAMEPRARQSVEAFKELLMVGHEGTIISRRPRKEFRNKIEFIFDHVKISETDKENHVKPNYKVIHDLVSNLARNHVIHIDCVEYLASRIGPKKTINLIQYIKDLAITKNFIVFLSIDSTAISEKDL